MLVGKAGLAYTDNDMPKRGLCYYAVILPRHYLLGLPGVLGQAVVCHFTPFELRRGIRIVDPIERTRAHFVSVVGMALDLIAQFDPIRFSRVQSEIQTIMSVPGTPGCDYQRPLRLCSTNLQSFYDRDYPGSEFAIKLLASTLIRDATSGHLSSRGIRRSKRNARRFDALCCREAQRFMRRLGMTITPWDPERLYHMGRWEALRWIWEDLRTL